MFYSPDRPSWLFNQPFYSIKRNSDFLHSNSNQSHWRLSRWKYRSATFNRDSRIRQVADQNVARTCSGQTDLCQVVWHGRFEQTRFLSRTSPVPGVCRASEDPDVAGDSDCRVSRHRRSEAVRVGIVLYDDKIDVKEFCRQFWFNDCVRYRSGQKRRQQISSNWNFG